MAMKPAPIVKAFDETEKKTEEFDEEAAAAERLLKEIAKAQSLIKKATTEAKAAED